MIRHDASYRCNNSVPWSGDRSPTAASLCCRQNRRQSPVNYAYGLARGGSVCRVLPRNVHGRCFRVAHLCQEPPPPGGFRPELQTTQTRAIAVWDSRGFSRVVEWSHRVEKIRHADVARKSAAGLDVGIARRSSPAWAGDPRRSTPRMERNEGRRIGRYSVARKNAPGLDRRRKQG